MPNVEAFLDVETTGLFPGYNSLTVVGIYLVFGDENRFLQLVGGEITGKNLLKALEGVDVIYTYNGSRFDLPFIHRVLGLDLANYFRHHDLMYDCWAYNLYGGLRTLTDGMPYYCGRNTGVMGTGTL